MRQIVLIPLLLFLAAGPALAEFQLTPGFYFNYGGLSTGTISRSYSLYATGNWDRQFYLTFGWEYLKMTQGEWSYAQNMAVLGGGIPILNRWSQKVFVIYIPGSDSSRQWTGGTEALVVPAAGWLVSIPIMGTWLRVPGQPYVRFQSAGARANYPILGPVRGESRVDFTLGQDRPVLAAFRQALTLSDSRGDYFKATGMLGKGRGYVNSDLYVVYNQPEVQREGWSASGTYWLWPPLGFFGMVEHDLFESYNVTYFALGLKGRIP